MSTQKIKNLSEKYYNKIVEIRHKVHMNPELAFEEFETAKLVANELKRMEIEVVEGIAKTGVVGLIRGKNPGKTILLRADMDALLVEEENDIPYKSRIKGKMHACGHDGHVAGVLGAAMILNDLKDELSGNIKLVFQPAEESQGGAKPMIEEGVLANPDVDAAIGCHLWGPLDEGEIHIKEGQIMAAPDVFTFKIVGQGGHAGLPHLSKDNVLIASQAICNIQSIVSRKVDPLKPLVISCCSIHGGSSHNVMPNEVEVKGTVRTLHKDVRDWAPKAIEDTLKFTSQAYGADYEFEYSKQYPTLVNNEEMVQLAIKSISKVLGEENVHEQEQATMGGEDFAYFAEMVPSVYYFIGITPKGKDKVLHHDPSFQYDDKNLLILSQSMAQIAVDFLNEN